MESPGLNASLNSAELVTKRTPCSLFQYSISPNVDLKTDVELTQAFGETQIVQLTSRGL